MEAERRVKIKLHFLYSIETYRRFIDEEREVEGRL
jgi:hypothetical protein